jgi:hypothetical protein
VFKHGIISVKLLFGLIIVSKVSLSSSTRVLKTRNFTLSHEMSVCSRFPGLDWRPHSSVVLTVTLPDTQRLYLSVFHCRGNRSDKLVISWQKVLKQAKTRVTLSLSSLILILLFLLWFRFLSLVAKPTYVLFVHKSLVNFTSFCIWLHRKCV